MNNSITLVAIADTNLKMTLRSLNMSRKKILFNKILLITSKDVKNLDLFTELKVIKINPIKSFKEYNNFIIFELHNFIKTSHVLIVQWDGFVINPEKWNNDFLKYDFIGAPFIPRAKDFNYSRDKNNKFYSVGNGGFSIRSRSLLKAASKFSLEDDIKFTSHHEDGFFCVLHREFLESKGYKWAPFNIAKEFAIESPISFNDLYSLPFGFHGKKILRFYPMIIFLNNFYKFIKLLKKK